MKGLDEIIAENKKADGGKIISDVEQRYVGIKNLLQEIELTKENCRRIIYFLQNL